MVTRIMGRVAGIIVDIIKAMLTSGVILIQETVGHDFVTKYKNGVR